MNAETAILILAAGASRRLGQPKQLLRYKGTTLLKHCIKQALQVSNSEVFVVLGAHCEAIQDTINDTKAHILYHKNWKQGMGSSLSFGVKVLADKSSFKRVLLTLGDLPLLTAEHYQSMIKKQAKSDKKIVVTQYKEMKGVPVVFDASYFSILEEVKGDEGAKQVVEKHKEDIGVVKSRQPFVDVDTKQAYEALLKLSDS